MMIEHILIRAAAMAPTVQFVKNLDAQRNPAADGLQMVIAHLIQKLNGITATAMKPLSLASRSTRVDGFWRPFAAVAY